MGAKRTPPPPPLPIHRILYRLLGTNINPDHYFTIIRSLFRNHPIIISQPSDHYFATIRSLFRNHPISISQPSDHYFATIRSLFRNHPIIISQPSDHYFATIRSLFRNHPIIISQVKKIAPGNIYFRLATGKQIPKELMIAAPSLNIKTLKSKPVICSYVFTTVCLFSVRMISQNLQIQGAID